MEFNATFIVAFLSFIIFTIIMNSILYKPINRIVEKRKKNIDAIYREVKSNEDKSKSILEDRKRRLEDASKNVKNRISEKTNLANKQKEEMALNAKKEAQDNLKNNRTYFSNAKSSAEIELSKSIVYLAQQISDKFLRNKDKIENFDENIIKEIMQG